MKIVILITISFLCSCAKINHISTSKGVLDLDHHICYKKMNGLSIESLDYDQAFYWCSKSALNGNVNAQVLLAEIYLLGGSDLKNYSKAVFWLDKAAEQGHSHAFYMLYLLHNEGIGVEKNFEKAVSWLNKAINKKHPLTKGE